MTRISVVRGESPRTVQVYKGVSPFERRNVCVAFHLLAEGSQSKAFFVELPEQ